MSWLLNIIDYQITSYEIEDRNLYLNFKDSFSKTWKCISCFSMYFIFKLIVKLNVSLSIEVVFTLQRQLLKDDYLNFILAIDRIYM